MDVVLELCVDREYSARLLILHVILSQCNISGMKRETDPLCKPFQMSCAMLTMLYNDGGLS